MKHGVDRVPQADDRYLPHFSFQIPVHDAVSAEDALDKAARALSAHRRADFVRSDGTVSVNVYSPTGRERDESKYCQSLQAARTAISREARKNAKKRQRTQEGREVAAPAVGANLPRPSQ